MDPQSLGAPLASSSDDDDVPLAVPLHQSPPEISPAAVTDASEVESANQRRQAPVPVTLITGADFSLLSLTIRARGLVSHVAHVAAMGHA